MYPQATAAYVLGAAEGEQQRLIAQADDYESRAKWLLDQIEVRPGWRVLDIGCGPIGILDLLSERVGIEGEVIGLEREPRFAEMARAEIARRGLRNVRIVEADALRTGLEKNSFDLVHERLLLINLPAREHLLTEMVSLLRPGGTIALEDVDHVSYLCRPPHPSWDALLQALHSALRVHGADIHIGRLLPELLRATGIQGVQAQAHVSAVRPGEFRRMHLLTLLDSLHSEVVGLGLLSKSELTRHKIALTRHLEDSQTILIDKLLVQAWGQKPEGLNALPTEATTNVRNA
jgi:ubiquinone/menaquinone biosynthesis C-methylase UbiE